MIKKCGGCGKDFKASAKKVKCCSRECGYMTRRNSTGRKTVEVKTDEAAEIEFKNKFIFRIAA